MICKHILLKTFLNEPKLFFTVKWFEALFEEILNLLLVVCLRTLK